MSYSTFKDSKGRMFTANTYRDSGHGVDTVWALEDAHYLDGELEDVHEDEIDFVYNDSEQEFDRVAYENAAGV